MDKLLLGVFLVTYSSKGNYIPFRYPLSIYDSEISLKSKDGPNPQNQQNPQEEPQQEPQQQQLTQKANEQKERTNGVHLDTKGIDSKDNIVLIKESDEHLQTNELSPKVVEDVDRQQDDLELVKTDLSTTGIDADKLSSSRPGNSGSLMEEGALKDAAKEVEYETQTLGVTQRQDGHNKSSTNVRKLREGRGLFGSRVRNSLWKTGVENTQEKKSSLDMDEEKIKEKLTIPEEYPLTNIRHTRKSDGDAVYGNKSKSERESVHHRKYSEHDEGKRKGNNDKKGYDQGKSGDFKQSRLKPGRKDIESRSAELAVDGSVKSIAGFERNFGDKVENLWIESTILGFDRKILSQILAVKPSQSFQRFEVSIDDVMFLGLPMRDRMVGDEDEAAKVVNKSGQGISGDFPKFRESGSGLGSGSGSGKNIRAPESINLQTKSKGPNPSIGGVKRGKHTERLTSGPQSVANPRSDRLSRAGFVDDLGKGRLGVSKKSARKSSIASRSTKRGDIGAEMAVVAKKETRTLKKYSSMFHVVFALDASSPHLESFSDRIYQCLIRPLSCALKWEQEQTNWVHQESQVLWELLRKATHEDWPLQRYMQQVTEQSELAGLLKRVYDDAISKRSTHVSLHGNVRVSLQVPTTPLLVRHAADPIVAQSWLNYRMSDFGWRKNQDTSLFEEYSQPIAPHDILKHITNSGNSTNYGVYMENCNDGSQVGIKLPTKAILNLQGESSLKVVSQYNGKDGSHVMHNDKSYQIDKLEQEHRNKINNIGEFYQNGNTYNKDIQKSLDKKKLVVLTSNTTETKLEAMMRCLELMHSEITHAERTSGLTGLDKKKPSGNKTTRNRESNDQHIHRRIKGSGIESGLTTEYTTQKNNIGQESIARFYRNIIKPGENQVSRRGSDSERYPLHHYHHPDKNLAGTGDYLPSDYSQYPTIEPYHSILLLTSPQELISKILMTKQSHNNGDSCSPTLLELIKRATPTRTLSELHLEIPCSFAQICRLTAHLVYWNEARIICPASVHGIYLVAPRINTSDNEHNSANIIEKYGPKFDSLFGTKGYRLSLVLSSLKLNCSFKESLLSIDNQTSNDYTNFADPIINEFVNGNAEKGEQNNLSDTEYNDEPQLHRGNEELYLEMLVFLLKHKLVVQVHTWPLLLVPLYVKLGMSEQEYLKIMKKKWEQSLKSIELVSYNKSNKSDNSTANKDELLNEFLKQTYNKTQWRPTSGYSKASKHERQYLLKLIKDKPKHYAKWFLDASIYFNGKHHLHEILFRECLTSSQFKQLIKPFSDLIILPCHY